MPKTYPYLSDDTGQIQSVSFSSTALMFYSSLSKANGYPQNQDVFLDVYKSMFGKYEAKEDIAYEYILAAFKVCVDKIPTATTDSTVRTHVTGHSLGGAYSSFCYAQILVDDAKLTQEKIQTGDEYIFGCPRVGSNDWAAMNQDLVSKKEGQSWRTVNYEDLVPQVPPTTLKPE
ncbi:hypothetical protein CGMCC3_g15482 [Colletotrichum fructicola]|nr:uncharacterized protein CGMCC3_g15482 [Colletotrichum fructicola]KAE9568401.1 hypothetical protein CGMCC3_g15482 [Colletotrichum fructicola]